MPDAAQRKILQDYSAGWLGTRQAIERAGLDGFADLLIALTQSDLPLPKPRPSAAPIARAILQPPLRKDGG